MSLPPSDAIDMTVVISHTRRGEIKPLRPVTTRTIIPCREEDERRMIHAFFSTRRGKNVNIPLDKNVTTCVKDGALVGIYGDYLQIPGVTIMLLLFFCFLFLHRGR